MPIETFGFISGLNPLYPEHTDPIAQADSHMRGIKQTLQNQFTNLGTVAVTATAAELNEAGAAFAGPTLQLQPQPTGSPAEGAEIDLLGIQASGTIVTAGAVSLLNAGTAGGNGLFEIEIYPSGTVSVLGGATPVTALTLTEGGNLTVPGTITANAYSGPGSVPLGGIIMWSGAASAVPTGWALCNGQIVNSLTTPNLVNKFVLGADDSTVTHGTTGGAFTASFTTSMVAAHNHTGATTTNGAHSHGGATGGYNITYNDMPSHTHGIGDPGHVHSYSYAQAVAPSYYPNSGAPWAFFNGYSAQNTSVSGTGVYTGAAGGNGGGHVHGIAVDGDHDHGIYEDGSHNHTGSVTVTNPYYALCLIMRVA